MSDKVDFNHLRNIIEDAPGFTLGKCDGILSKDDSHVIDFKLKVIPFCIENEKRDYNAVEKIVTTDNYASVQQIRQNLQDYDECNKFAKAFVNEVTAKIKDKKWYHQIVIMQCAIIDAIHTIFTTYAEPSQAYVNYEIIHGLADNFNTWFDNLKNSNTKASDIDTTVKNFSKRLLSGKSVYESNDQRFEEFLKSESNDQRFEEFLKSFETNYMNTDNYDWIDTCTQGLASTEDITTLKTQLTNLKKAIQAKHCLDASSAKLIAALSNTLEKIFEVGNNSKDAVRHSVTAVIEQQQKKQQQKLLQNFLDKLDTSCLPFNAYAWWEYFVESTLFDNSLDNPLWNFMQCVTSEIDDVNITKKTKELSDALCNAFAVKNTTSVTEQLKEIVQRAKEAQETTKKKYNANIVENLLNVIDYVDAQGTVDLNPKSNIWLLVLNELCAFIATKEQQKTTLEFIYGVFKEINEQLDQETLAESATDFLVNSGVIKTDEKGPAVEKIKGKIEELQNKRTKKSTTPVNTDFAPTQTIVENDTKQLQQKSRLLTPKPKPPKTISQKQEITANTNTLPTLSEKSADFKVTTSQNNTDNLEEITINSYKPNDTGQLIHKTQKAQIPSVLADHWNTCENNLSDENQPLTGGTCVICNIIVRIVRYLHKNQPSDAIKLIGQLKNKKINNNSPTDINSPLDMWIKQIEENTVTFSNHDRKFMSFAERAVSKQARQKRTNQKTKNTNMLVEAIKKIPSNTRQTTDDDQNYEKIKLVLNSDHSDLVKKLKNLKLETHLRNQITIKTIEQIAKQIRNTADNITSDSIMALAVLYTILRNIEHDNTTEQDTSTKQTTSTTQTTLIAFAKWFNKYVNPRSAIRSPTVVTALNTKIGDIAKTPVKFKCGKLKKAKNTAKEIAKKISTKRDSSVDTNSGSAGHKKRKREKLKSTSKKLSPRKLISRKKKQEPNKEA